MDIKNLVSKVDGLNTVSTAKNWVYAIERISGHKFKMVLDQVGYTRRGGKKISKRLDFTEKDAERFQDIAYLKDEMTLTDAIKLVYGDLESEKEQSIQDEIETLRRQKRAILDNMVKLTNRCSTLERKVNELEEQLISVKDILDKLPFGLGKVKSGK